MNDPLERLKELKKKVDDLRSKQNITEGKKESLMITMDEQFGISSIEELKSKKEEIEKVKVDLKSELGELEEKLEKRITKLENII